MKVLLLAGTAEARTIADALRQDGRFQVVASLAGATAAPKDLGVETRTGGFGGKEGLARTIADNRIDLLVDATHPFAARMKHHASRQEIPVVHVIRPPWPAGRGWTVCDTLDDAAGALPPEARAFLALGQRHLHAFTDHPAMKLVRSVDPPDIHTGGFRFIQGAPGSVDEEVALLKAHRITHLVCRNSGGTAGRAKIEAAEALGLDLIVVDRPPPPPGAVFETADEAVRWCVRLLNRASPR